MKLEAKKISDLVLQYFASIDDGIRDLEEVKPKEPEKVWQVADVNHSITRINIVLEKIEIKPEPAPAEPQTGPELKPIHKFALKVIHKFSYQTPDNLEKHADSPPSTPETAVHENDFTSDFGSNMQMYYDIDLNNNINLDNDLRSQLEALHLEDIDIYAPLSTNEQEYRDITHDDQVFDRDLFMLVPDSEEFAMWEVSKRNAEEKPPEMLTLARFQSEMYPFPNQTKKEWRIFEDMELEKVVYEFGGNWDLIADLMSMSKHTISDFYTADECYTRWVILQKRKGRTVNLGFKPQPALIPTLPPIQRVPSRYSLFHYTDNKKIVFPKIDPNFRSSDMNEFLDFHLHNLNFENNYYFYHYQTINSKYYNPVAAPPTIKPSPKPDLDFASAFKIKQIPEHEKKNEISPISIINEHKLKSIDMIEMSLDKPAPWSNNQQAPRPITDVISSQRGQVVAQRTIRPAQA